MFTIQDLYRFVFQEGAEIPFSLNMSYPQRTFTLCSVGDDTITSHHLEGNLLLVKTCAFECPEELDKFLDALELTEQVCHDYMY